MKRLATLLASLCLMQSAHAQTITSAVPGFISYQGRALNSTGTVMGSGTPVNRTVTFRIWDHASNSLTANLVYSEQQVVTIAEGEFSVLVGAGSATAGTPLGYSESGKGPPTVKINDLGVFGGANRFLGVTIDDGTAAVDNEVSPRQQIVSSAYALRSRYAEQLGSNGGTALTALDSGNVGIGNTSPPSRFTVTAAATGTTPQLLITADDVSKRLRIGVDSTDSGTGFIQAFKEGTGVQNLLLNPNGGSVGIGGPANSTIALAVTGSITATTSIGIGTTTPNFPLSMSNALGDKIALHGVSGAHFGLGVQNNQFQIHTDTNVADVVFGYGTSAAMTETMRIKGNGKVGIGTAQPANLFSVQAPITALTATNTVTSGNAIAAIGASDVALHFGNHNNNNGYASWIQSMRTWDNYAFPISLNPNGGDVGIGISLPTAKLDVNGNAYVRGKIDLNGAIIMGDSQWIYGKNITNEAELAFLPRASNGTYLNYGTSGFFIRNNASTNTMVMTDTGRVGIGTTDPGAPLHVTKKFDVQYTLNPITNFNGNFTPQLGNADGYTSAGAIGMVGQFWQTSIYADGVVAGSAFVAMSDLRIKDIVNRSSPQSDLALINQLQVTDYRLKDSIANGSAIRKGFIAQEVRKIIPEAVGPSPGYIPDIYVLATQSVYDAAQKRLSVTLTKPHALAVGEWVRIYGDDNTVETKVLTVESATSFTVASEKPMAKAFVYGRRVDDFLTVDYDRLFTTGIGAIQHLSRQMTSLQDENAALRRELAAKDKSMEARLIALERRMSGESAAKTVSIKTVSLTK